MSLINLEKVSLAFGHHQLLEQVNLSIHKSDKIGLIGRNGSGKSSLLKILAGINQVDNGVVKQMQGIKIAYVPQEHIFTKQNIYDEILTAADNLAELFLQYDTILPKLTATPNEQNLLKQLHEVQEQLDTKHAWNTKSQIDKWISTFDLDKDITLDNLSGGKKKKVALIKALITNPDVLLLDEPTNHLDIASINQLENIINNFTGSVIVITHDRVFLENTVNKIVELDRGKLNVYPNSYSKYQEWKSTQLAIEEKANHDFDKFLAQEEVWIRKGVEARRTRNEGRVKRLEQLRKERAARRERTGNVNFNLEHGSISGKIVAQLEKISLNFGSQIILKDFSATITRGDKIGLIGPNGIGKSTLLKIILGELAPDSGKVKLGTKLEIAYFDQLRLQLDETLTVQDVVSQGQEYVEINNRKMHIATYLEEFLFPAERFRSPIKALSGGERNRLLLARMFSKPANVLVLDEPTNDLDMETMELLEELLSAYSGTVFLVSHDRKFLDNIVTQSYVFQSTGKIVEIAGGYSEYLTYYANTKKQPTNNNQPLEETTPKRTKSTSNRLSYKEKQELLNLPQKIEDLEQEQQQLQNKLLDNDTYKSTPHLVKEYQLRLKDIEHELHNALNRWEILESIN